MNRADEHLLLEDFLPYRLSILSNTVSANIAKLYQQKFGLSILEWRALAVIGRFAPMSASQVAERTAMDKVQVSRALQRLADGGKIERSVDAKDRRRSVLRLSSKGKALVKRITPLAMRVEEELLGVLSVKQYRELDAILHLLQARSKAMAETPLKESTGKKRVQRAP